jgi:diadenosine tetraphosphatase ApaH/serine/threonine PP2A family protein phosphatase
VLIALLADIHANLDALEACLAHARAAGAGRYAFLGDLVGYGADPAAVVELVRQHAASGAVVVQGNHDAAGAGWSGDMSEHAREAIRWTREALGADAKAYLASLPLAVHEGRLCFVHASADRPARWEYVEEGNAARRSVDAAGAAWTFSGHVHRQTLYFEAGGAAMGEFQPTPGTAIPLFDDAGETLTFHRVPYDHHSAARKLRAAGLPSTLDWGPR